jgi:hypothetical protein
LIARARDFIFDPRRWQRGLLTSAQNQIITDVFNVRSNLAEQDSLLPSGCATVGFKRFSREMRGRINLFGTREMKRRLKVFAG